MNALDLWVKRNDLRNTRVVEYALPALADGDVRLKIDMFALTANNVSYAVAGDSIGYWQFYPAEGEWGKVPVWGCADVVDSRHPDVPVGERVWGFLPMATHVDISPARVRADQFTDGAAHRQQLPAVYNSYRRISAEPAAMRALEVERCLFFPLFITSWLLYDYLLDNACFGAQQIIIGSVSSKTGFALAQFLHRDRDVTQKIVGVTSPANVPFIEKLGCCDQIITYGDEQAVDAGLPAAYVDMSGNAALTRALHKHLGEQMKESCAVGATHWESPRGAVEQLPGAKPQFFFAPVQIAKRDGEWGAGATMQRANAACAEIAHVMKDDVSVTWTRDAQALQTLWREMLDNRIPGNAGQMVALA